ESVSFLKAIYVYLLNEKRLPTAVDAPLLYFYSYRFFDDNPFQYGRVNGDAPMSYAFDLDRPEIELPARPPSAPTIRLDRGGLVEVLKVLAETSTTSMD